MTSTAVADSRRQRPRKRSLVWIRRILLGFIVFLVAIAGAGLIYQAVAERIDQRNFPPPGQLVDVGVDVQSLVKDREAVVERVRHGLIQPTVVSD